MYHKFLSLRCFLLGLVLSGLAALPSTAQTQFAKTVISSTSVSSARMAIDGAMETAAVLQAPLIGAAKMRLGFAMEAPAGKTAGLLIRPSALLKVGLLNNVTVNTYKQGSSGERESLPLSQLLTLDLQSTSPTMVYFMPQQAFDHIELVVGGLVNLGLDMELYEAFAGFVPTPLPIVLTTFAGQASPTGVTLIWETASESNTAHFVIERAERASTDFRALGEVQSAGTSTQAHRYQFVDATPGGLCYYRLRQVDRNGQQSFSPVIAVQAAPRSAALAAYPSPATDRVTVAGPAGTVVRVFDQVGHQVRRVEISPAQVQQLDVRSLPNGVYFVQNVSTGERSKFLKVNGFK
jgi:hypothetical protein